MHLPIIAISSMVWLIYHCGNDVYSLKKEINYSNVIIKFRHRSMKIWKLRATGLCVCGGVLTSVSPLSNAKMFPFDNLISDDLIFDIHSGISWLPQGKNNYVRITMANSQFCASDGKVPLRPLIAIVYHAKRKCIDLSRHNGQKQSTMWAKRVCCLLWSKL